MGINVYIITTAHRIDDVRVYEKFAIEFLKQGFKVFWIGPYYYLNDNTKLLDKNICYFLFPMAENKLDRLLSLRHLILKSLLIRDVSIFYSPDPDSAFISILLSKILGGKVIFDIHELFHETLIENYLPGILERDIGYVIKKIIYLISKLSDMNIAVNKSVLNAYVSNKKKAFIIRNCPRLSFAEDVLSGKYNKKSGYTIFHGKAEYSRGTLLVLSALSLCVKSIPNLKCIMIDTIKAKEKIELINKIKSLGLENVVEIIQPVSMREMADIYRKCDIGIIGYNYKYGKSSLPNRLFEYMAMGLPIIAPIYSIEIAKIINKEKCGILADFRDPEDVAKAFIECYKRPEERILMGKRGQDAFINMYNWDKEVKPLINWIKENS